MYDQLTTLGSSTIQHGKYNDRIYLVKLNENDLPEIADQIDRLADTEGYTKCFAKIPMEHKGAFLVRGYRQEASIPNFYAGKLDAAFLGKYFAVERQNSSDQDRISEILSLAKAKSESDFNVEKRYSGFSIRKMMPSDAEEMSAIYKIVFKTYPFPIHEVDYLKQTMTSHVDYFGVLEGDKIVALASSEFDTAGQNVEMTDFATLPDYRGNGFAVYLLDHMEKTLEKSSIKTAYTIARAISPGMNITFAKLGYHFGGTLINNTNISGNIESMNTWYKTL